MILMLSVFALFISLTCSIKAYRNKERPEPTTPLLPHHEWWTGLQRALDGLTLATIDAFDPGSVPTTRAAHDVLYGAKKQNSIYQSGFHNVSFTHNEIRKQQESVYLYGEYDVDDYEVTDDFGYVVKQFESEVGVGKPIAVRVGTPIYDPNRLCEFTVWKCITHDNMRMKFNSPDYAPLVLSDVAKQFRCSDCEAEKRDPSLTFKRMGVQEIPKYTEMICQ